MNTYEIKIALNPENKKYKSVILSGIVFAKYQAKAVELAIKKVKEIIDEKPEIKFQPKLYSARKLNTEFLIFEKNDDEATKITDENDNNKTTTNSI